MNSRIEKDFSFQTGVYFEKDFRINIYDITLSMLVETNSVREQDIAMSRAEHFLCCVLQDSILVNTVNNDIIKKYQSVGLRVCELPDEPYDQVLAMVLLLKLNTIMENRLKITDMVIGSMMSGGIRFSLVSEMAENINSGKHWWNSPCLSIIDCSLEKFDHTKIIKLFNDDDWMNLGLSWRETVKN